MPTGRVKVFNEQRNFGFVSAENGEEVFFHADVVKGDGPTSGAVVEYELEETDNGDKRASTLTVVKPAPADNPVGRTLSPPPTWEELEERERQRRQARRRRR